MQTVLHTICHVLGGEDVFFMTDRKTSYTVATIPKMSQFYDNATFSFASAQTWPNLRVTFGLNPFGSAFYPYPLTAQEASDAGWQLISSCGDTNPTWLGNRFNSTVMDM